MSNNKNEDIFETEVVSEEVRKIPIDQIEDVDWNPRFGSGRELYNESYEDIKASIAGDKGKYLQLEVVEDAQKPGFYRLFKGGSTRLKIAKELNNIAIESNSPSSFQFIKCVVYPGVTLGEQVVLTATENLNRGDLCYGEKAEAFYKILESYKEEYLQSEKFNIKEFLDYTNSIGLKNLVPTPQEYANLKGCYESFVATNVLNEKIVTGRANREFVRGALTLKNKFIQEFDSESQKIPEDEWESICSETDSVDLTLGILKQALEKYSASSKSEKISNGRKNKFDEAFDLCGIDPESQLTDDNRRNGLIILGEILRTGDYSTSRRKTNKLKAMGIDNNLAGFLKLIRVLPRKAQTIAVRQMLNSTEEGV